MTIFLIVWVVIVSLALVFNYGAHEEDREENKR